MYRYGARPAGGSYLLEGDFLQAPVDVEEREGTRRPGVILIRRAARIDERHAVEDVKERVVRLAEDDTVDVFPKDILWFLGVGRKRIQRSDIVRDAHLEPVEILYADIRERSQVKLEVVATDRE